MSGKDTYYIGEQSLTFPKDVYIISSASVVGKKEGEGPLGGAFDMICVMTDLVKTIGKWQKVHYKKKPWH